MPHLTLLTTLTVLVLVCVALAVLLISPNDLSGYGSILSAGAAFLAIIWFSATLWYQSKQLEDQRNHFSAQFKKLQEASKRDSLLTANTILEAAEQRAVAAHGGITSFSELPGEYLNFLELKPIMESDDPEVVLDAAKSWYKKEGAALAVLKGIKSAAELYAASVGMKDIDFSKSPEEFVFVYGPKFWDQPFFEAYQGTATLLAELMVTLEPGRSAVHIAVAAASAKSIDKKIVRIDQVRESIAKHKERGYPVPKIANDL